VAREDSSVSHGIEIRHERADGAAGRVLLAEYFTDVERRLGEFDASRTAPASTQEMARPRGAFLVLYADGRPLGCGGVKTLEPGVGEIKRIWIVPAGRRRGHARRLLAALEDAARGLGHRIIRLDTAAAMPEAQALYASSGYREIPAYNDNPYAARWYEKRL